MTYLKQFQHLITKVNSLLPSSLIFDGGLNFVIKEYSMQKHINYWNYQLCFWISINDGL